MVYTPQKRNMTTARSPPVGRTGKGLADDLQ